MEKFTQTSKFLFALVVLWRNDVPFSPIKKKFIIVFSITESKFIIFSGSTVAEPSRIIWKQQLSVSWYAALQVKITSWYVLKTFSVVLQQFLLHGQSKLPNSFLSFWCTTANSNLWIAKVATELKKTSKTIKFS